MPKYTELSAVKMRQTLGQQLIPVADCIRDILTQAGLRPYRVCLVRTRWSAGIRGQGSEFVISREPLLPTPKLMDLEGLAEIVSASGLSEQGDVMVSEVSGRYAEAFLRGAQPSGDPWPEENFFWEIEFPDIDGNPGERRRFAVGAAPWYDASGLEWKIHLRRQRDGRERNGDTHP